MPSLSGCNVARLTINTPLHVRHIENLANMAKQGLFVYKGRANVPDATFPSGECAMYTGSSALYSSVSKNAKFAYGMSTLPYYPDVPGAPQNTVIGGASLWTLAGKKPDDYKGVAMFLNHLSKPEVAHAVLGAIQSADTDLSPARSASTPRHTATA